MQKNSKEVETRNDEIISLNESNSIFQERIDQLPLYYFQEKIPNIIEVVIEKNNELERFFYSHNQNYYSDSVTGIIIRNEFSLYIEEACNLISYAVTEETTLKRLILKRMGIILKNKYYEAYKQVIQRIKTFEIKENFAPIIASYLHSESELEEFVVPIKEELTALGYEELAQSIYQNSIDFFQEKKVYQKQ